MIFQKFYSSCQEPCRSNKVVVSVLMVMIVSYPLFIHNGIVNHKNDKCSHCLSQTDLVSSSISETLLSASNTTAKKCVQNVLPKTCPWAIIDKPYSLYSLKEHNEHTATKFIKWNEKSLFVNGSKQSQEESWAQSEKKKVPTIWLDFMNNFLG